MSRSVFAFVMVLLCFQSSAKAVMPGEQLAESKQEARARAISSELRCLVCQNQSIDDSDASLARDLRLLVRERIRAGDSDAAVRSYLVSRYGEFILLRPSLNWQTFLLWSAPAFALLLGAIAARSAFRRRNPEELEEAPEEALSESEAAAVQTILERQRNPV